MTEMGGQIDWREREWILGVELVENLGKGCSARVESVRIKVGGRKGRGHWEEMWAADIEEGVESKRIIFRPNGEKDLKYHRIEKYSEEKKRWIRLPAQEAAGILQGLAL
ncbi:hypothetical protein HYU91_00040 [Candidatus Collierbacteria bacterium]|nr:hypothetical protein [Candidatus Collierbacteria bacterium]